MEIFIRSTLFHILFCSWSTLYSLAAVWAFALPRAQVHKVLRPYYNGVNWLEENVLKLKCEVRGWEHLPKDGSYIIAAKHQSLYETLHLCYLLGDPAIVLKREITIFVPLWGWYLAKLGMIPIDRGKGVEAMSKISKAAEKVIQDGRPIILFPQGTRVPPGEKRDYKIGVAKLYKDLNVPMVPMALNSGMFWPKRSYLKKPGTIVFEFHPPIPPGLPPRQVLKDLQGLLDERSDALCNESA